MPRPPGHLGGCHVDGLGGVACYGGESLVERPGIFLSSPLILPPVTASGAALAAGTAAGAWHGQM